MKSFYARILCYASDYVVERRLLDIAHCCEFIDREASVFAELADARDINFRVFHIHYPFLYPYMGYEVIIIAVNMDCDTRIRVFLKKFW